jgi:ankyrin repeat protein
MENPIRVYSVARTSSFAASTSFLVAFLTSLLASLTLFASEDSRLIKAVHDGSLKQVVRLALNKRELNWKDSAGQDALFYAVSLNDIEKARALLKAGAVTSNLYTAKKETLLFEATRLGSPEMLKMLLQKDPQLLKVKNSDGETALFTAVREDQSRVASYLIKKGLSKDQRNNAGQKPSDLVDPKNKDMMNVFSLDSEKKPHPSH